MLAGGCCWGEKRRWSKGIRAPLRQPVFFLYEVEADGSRSIRSNGLDELRIRVVSRLMGRAALLGRTAGLRDVLSSTNFELFSNLFF